MFYIKTIKFEGFCKEGDLLMTLADFSGIPAGMKGTVASIYKGGIIVEWENGVRDGFKTTELKYLGFATHEYPGKDKEVETVNAAALQTNG